MSTKSLLKITALIVLVVALNFVKTLAATIVVNSNITTNTTWTNNNHYILTGIVYVTNNAILTINAGTVVQGDSATLGSLVITRGAKINAIGTACQPIVFTSEKPVGHRNRGDWGGLIILGYAAVNWPGDTGHIEGIVPNNNTLYGGGKNPNCSGGDCPSNSDNSGTLQYVRIEFAGIALSPNNEINGLTMGGVGSGTTIDHIQVSYSNDDSYEWFGGTVNCKYLIAYNGLDDDFDTDNGYSGKVQFALGIRDPSIADVSGSKSFESDNDPTGTTNTPVTSAIFQNVTALGGSSNNGPTNPLFNESVHIRRNSKVHINNSILMGFPLGILVDGSRSIFNCQTSSLLNNNYLEQATGRYIKFAGWTNPQPDLVNGDTATARTNLQGSGNVLSSTYSGVLANPDFPITNVKNMVPAAGNPLPASNTALYTGGFWTSVSYVGAFNPAGDNWAGDWAKFDPLNVAYPTGKINYTPTLALNLITNSICPNTGGVDINVSGGITPYNYVWSNGATTQDLTSIPKGTYTITVYDAGGNCSAPSKKYKVINELPILTNCNSTSTSITVFWSGNLAGAVTGYQIRFKKHSVSNYGAWTSAGNGNSKVVTGLLSNTQYDFQLRGTCTSGNTAISTVLTCSTTARLANETANGQVLNIYPNPSTGQFRIDLKGFATGSLVFVKVSNVLGKVVYNIANASTDASIDMNLVILPSGMYNVVISDGINQLTQNIILDK